MAADRDLGDLAADGERDRGMAGLVDRDMVPLGLAASVRWRRSGIQRRLNG